MRVNRSSFTCGRGEECAFVRFALTQADMAEGNATGDDSVNKRSASEIGPEGSGMEVKRPKPE